MNDQTHDGDDEEPDHGTDPADDERSSGRHWPSSALPGIKYCRTAAHGDDRDRADGDRPRGRVAGEDGPDDRAGHEQGSGQDRDDGARRPDQDRERDRRVVMDTGWDSAVVGLLEGAGT